MLDRKKSKSDKYIGNEAKIGPSVDVHFTGAVRGRSVAGKIDCEIHEDSIVRRKLKLSGKQWKICCIPIRMQRLLEG